MTGASSPVAGDAPRRAGDSTPASGDASSAVGVVGKRGGGELGRPIDAAIFHKGSISGSQGVSPGPRVDCQPSVVICLHLLPWQEAPFRWIMHFTNRAFVLSADDADDADKNQENLRSSVKSADSKHKSLLTA